jgi:pilus assembly protein Flp/PilA
MYDVFDLIKLIKAAYKDRRGVTALEYGLIAGGISMLIITAVNNLGTKISGIFTNLSTAAW